MNDRTSFTFDAPALTDNVIYGPSYYNQLAGGIPDAAVGVTSRFEYFTGKGVVTMTGSVSGTMVSWQAGNLETGGVLEVHNVDRYTSVKCNNQALGAETSSTTRPPR